MRCFDAAAEQAMIDEIKAAAKDGDSLGGVVEVLGYGVPIGLGSHVHWDRKLDALLAQAIMSIQAVKGVEIGDGFEVAGRRGSAGARRDHVGRRGAATTAARRSLAGGTEGGMTTGELLVVRAAMKPLATLNRPTLKTVDVVTKESTVSFKERTDVTAVPAMGVVAETMVALVLAAEAQRKFGGDSVGEFVRNATAFTALARPADPSRSVVTRRPAPRARRADGHRQDHRRPDRRRTARTAAWSTAMPSIEARTGRTVREIFAGRRRAGVPRAGDARCCRGADRRRAGWSSPRPAASCSCRGEPRSR